MELGNLENLQESFVERALEEIFRGSDPALLQGFCGCMGCRIDVVALALNSLPPKYVADKYYKFPEGPGGNQEQYERARRAVVLAIRRVKRRPHCERDEGESLEGSDPSSNPPA